MNYNRTEESDVIDVTDVVRHFIIRISLIIIAISSVFVFVDNFRKINGLYCFLSLTLFIVAILLFKINTRLIINLDHIIIHKRKVHLNNIKAIYEIGFWINTTWFIKTLDSYAIVFIDSNFKVEIQRLKEKLK